MNLSLTLKNILQFYKNYMEVNGKAIYAFQH